MSEFEHWQKRYSEPDYVFGTAPNAFLAAQEQRLCGYKTALSVADGEGRNGVWLAEQGLDVRAIDYSPVGLAKARALAKARGVSLETEVADITTWRWPQSAYDVIVAIFIFVSVAERPAFFAHMKNALRPGGLLIIEGYRPEQVNNRTGGPPDAERLYTRTLLEDAFGDLAELEIREYDSVINEGSRHVGMSALIDLVGRK